MFHKENGNNLYCADYTCDGKKLIVGGSDRNLYVYDESNRTLISTLHSRDEKLSGHQNRIYSIKSSRDDPNIFVSAGWDGNLKVYDIAQGLPIASILGPHCSNDSIDIFGDMILVGSMRNEQVMQLFSIS